MKMDLRWHDTTYTVTLYQDGNFSAASASAASGATNTEITLTLTPNTGYELDDVEVIAGGVTVNLTTKKFTIKSANVILFAKAKKNNVYKVTENCFTCINGTVVNLTRNMMLEVNANGAIVGVTCSGSEITKNDAIQNLIDTGVLIKM